MVCIGMVCGPSTLSTYAKSTTPGASLIEELRQTKSFGGRRSQTMGLKKLPDGIGFGGTGGTEQC